MYYSQRATHLTGFILTVLLSYIIAYSEVGGENRLKLKIGFDLSQGTNGVPSLQIRNFDEMTRKLNGHNKKLKRSLRSDSSSDSDEVDDNKKEADDVKVVQETDLSDDVESSGSEDRRYSTKGLNPEDFEPENKPNIHDKSEDSE